VQESVEAVENGSSLTLMILATWRLARVLAVKIVEEVLTERAQRPTQWSDCPQCGARLNSKGVGWDGVRSIVRSVIKSRPWMTNWS